MMNRVLRTAVLTACWITAAAGLYAGVADRAPARRALALEPAAPVADRPSVLIRDSLASQPVEPIPVGELGPFGTAAAEDTAPVAPAAEPAYPLLDLRNDPDPADAAAPVTPATEPAR